MTLRLVCERCGYESPPRVDTTLPVGWSHVRVVTRRGQGTAASSWRAVQHDICAACTGAVRTCLDGPDAA